MRSLDRPDQPDEPRRLENADAAGAGRSRGYEMGFSHNWWTNPEYRGVNTRWVNQEGQRFEVQFHTPDSFHAKHHVTHAAYERIRDPRT
ncbi:MAG: hypothetical protein ACRDPY_29860, partial [Streptosporangiaceae bacterium]